MRAQSPKNRVIVPHEGSGERNWLLRRMHTREVIIPHEGSGAKEVRSGSSL